MRHRSWIGSIVLLIVLFVVAGGLAAWKHQSALAADAASAHQAEPTEVITAAVAEAREHRRTTTSIGTVLALRSITLRNEVAGTVSDVRLTPGQVVEKGTLLVALDVSVEEAELKAQQAEVALAETLLRRVEKAQKGNAASDNEVDRARGERDVAVAQIARIKAIIDRKMIHAPFKARVGLADVHPGQFLEEGTELTTLQGVDDAVHVDFTVEQRVAATLREGDTVEVFATREGPAVAAEIVAIDARIDVTTRNAVVRARIEHAEHAPAPGASVRVRVPVGPPRPAVAIPVSGLRRGPGGDFVFVIAPDRQGQPRAQQRKVVSGGMVGDEVLIAEGLKPGEKIAASGSFKLREGVLVAIADPSAPAAATTEIH